MNRDEILAKSRAEKDDEGMRHVQNRGNSWGLQVMALLSLIIYLYDWHRDYSNYAIIALFSANFAADRFSAYLFTKKKSELYVSIITAIMSLMFLIDYFFGR